MASRRMMSEEIETANDLGEVARIIRLVMGRDVTAHGELLTQDEALALGEMRNRVEQIARRLTAASAQGRVEGQ